MKNKLIFPIAALLLAACHKDEIPIPPQEAGDAIEVEIPMGQTYKNQLFYSLESNIIVSSNEKTIWDLAFESSSSGWHIRLNTSKGMAVHRSDLSFVDVTDETGLTWNWDSHTGNMDSTAIGDWQAEDKLYVIDLGYNDLGIHLGFIKMNIDQVTSTAYHISYGNLNDVTPQHHTIIKNTDNLYTYFSFQSGAVTVAPPNESWDLKFTQYLHLFTEPEGVYIVVGVLLNRYNTTAAKITDKPFTEITYSDVVGLDYSSRLDFIGYDWKIFDFESSLFVVDPTISYIIKSQHGIFYKLHFIDFYNSEGIKGYPTFEVQAL